MAKKKQRKELVEDEANFAKDVEKASEPIMDRARQIKEEASQATEEIKIHTEAIRAKTEKLMEAGGKYGKSVGEAGGKFAGETRAILLPESEGTQPANFCEQYGLRGRKLSGLLAGIILIAILAVYSKTRATELGSFLLLTTLCIYLCSYIQDAAINKQLILLLLHCDCTVTALLLFIKSVSGADTAVAQPTRLIGVDGGS